MSKAVLLDRDGTLIVERNYLADPDLVELERGVVPGLQALQAAGYLLIVVTNQAGIGRGLITVDEFRAVQARLFSELRSQGIAVAGAYFCPHHPTEGKGRYMKDCQGRKPNPGMLEAAIARHGLERARCFMVGDTRRDVEAGRRAGMRSVLVRTGYAEGGGEGEGVEPDYVAEDLYDAAVGFILRGDGVG